MENFGSTFFVAAILLGISLPQVFTQTNESDCRVAYTSQPPVAIFCNPYFRSQLTLNCVLRIDVSSSNFTVNWYHNAVPVSPNPPTTKSDNPVSGIDTYTSALLLNESTIPVSSGNYFCQVNENGRDLKPSSTFTLLDEIEYGNFRNCEIEESFSSMSFKCADIPVTTTEAPAMPTTPVPSQTTPPGTTASVTVAPTTDGPGSTNGNSMIPEGLEVWIYVLVAIAAVFGMIIVILSIMCVGLCLRRNKTQDSQTLKHNGTGITIGSSMVSNEIYSSTENNFSAPPPEYPAYSTVGNREYEIIASFEHTQGYAHLNHHSSPPPLPNSLPNGRSLNSSPPMRERANRPSTPELEPKGGVPSHHVYGELEHPSSYSCSTSPPVSVFERGDSGQHLLPFSQANGGPYRQFPSDSTTPSMNESLYSPTTPLPVSTGLEDIPETGMSFQEPEDPTSFPVHEYEVIPAAKKVKKYESPVPEDRTIGANPQTRTSVKSANYETDPKLNTSNYDSTHHMTTAELYKSPTALTSPNGGGPTFEPAYSKLAYKPRPQPHPQQFDQEFFNSASEVCLHSNIYVPERRSREVTPVSNGRRTNSTSASPPPFYTRDSYSKLNTFPSHVSKTTV